MSDELLETLLAKPVGPERGTSRKAGDAELTRQIEVRGNTAEVELNGPESEVDDSLAYVVLREQGLEPDEWEVTGFRSSEWTMFGGRQGVSKRFSFKRVASLSPNRPALDELIAAIEPHKPAVRRPSGDHGYLVLLGDMQFGKIDGDGVEGTLHRTVESLNRAADLLPLYRHRYDIGHIHIGWLGDHIEGFVSQGGANVWRTQLSLNEQIRLTRRVMLHALTTFAPLAERVSMAAVPGNHGETVRFGGKGLTRYDDSHDTESLIAVKDAADLNPERFGHVEFYVPDTDELTVVVECSGSIVAHAHGHQFRPGKHFEWWKGQAFGRSSAMHQADVLLAGHLHHEFVEADGPRTFIQVPSMESESTWFRHSKGAEGAPGLIVAVTKDGRVPVKEVVTQ